MQSKFPTIGADSPIGQLAGVLRSSASQGKSNNNSATTTPLASPRGDPQSKRSSTFLEEIHKGLRKQLPQALLGLQDKYQTLTPPRLNP